MKVAIGLLCVLMLTISCGISKNASMTKEEKKAAKIEHQQVIKKAIEAQQFVFEPNQAIGQKGFTVQVGGQGYSLKVMGDTAKAYLPFYGRAFASAGMGYGDATGVEFDSTLSDTKWTYNEKKKNHTFTGQAERGSDVYNLTLDIFENGSATLMVVQTNRSPMTYYGEVLPIEEVEK